MGLATWRGQAESLGDLGTRGSVNRALATCRLSQVQEGPSPLLPRLRVTFHQAAEAISLYCEMEARRGVSFTGGCVASSGCGGTLVSLSCVIYKALFGLVLQFVG